ncbi:putative Transport-associated protein [Thiomonas arsenitoxydans]|uniref:Transport-associated protein n=1 Tax=Thiomonas arsenitoxydans (strain DSM 22701 / CIP 110005 / 3As) TaxID=426114 RepID=D6CRQ3_THIA3|nr:BON domain-containing protein [Thiomonas arsenitoxydans]MDE2174522.1 BON domain-containing protein [Betaproteobacteria bacterium]CAZ87294.1 putative Transport-associated protein [Thiomonas arsenitoxydans]CQR28781.1 putative Transport-associated protein [Thiomonas arsenitoxydans]CQR28782.1 putative Transport-associated protein [Thiomonas arsenitoxydans]CQR28857.1 putative Transport-associated protein [Thiomonas arsenitoxydans]
MTQMNVDICSKSASAASGVRRSRGLWRAASLLTVVLAATQLQGCFVLGLGAVGTTAYVATDRRTAGSILEDNTIELKADNRISSALGAGVNVRAVSYNQQVLLVGQVPSEADKQKAEQVVKGVPNVKAVLNEIDIGPVADLNRSATDTLITTKVRARLIDARDIFGNAFKVTTSNSVVYLMGIVTQREADRAVQIARDTTGVSKVVTMFNIISEQQLQDMRNPQKENAPPPEPRGNNPA